MEMKYFTIIIYSMANWMWFDDPLPRSTLLTLSTSSTSSTGSTRKLPMYPPTCSVDRDDQNGLQGERNTIKMDLSLWGNRSPDHFGLKDLGKMIEMNVRDEIDYISLIVRIGHNKSFFLWKYNECHI
jgi:hypothetical protein